jgi:hypothetical protein
MIALSFSILDSKSTDLIEGVRRGCSKLIEGVMEVFAN